MKKVLIYAAVAVAVIAGAVLLGRLFRIRLEERIRAEIVAGMVAQRDTVTLRDTVTIRDPAPAPIVIRDTVVLRVYVPGEPYPVEVPAERVQRHYGDARFDAWVSGLQVAGIGPSLDSIRFEKITQNITQTVEAPAPRKRPLRIGAEGFVTVTPRKDAPGLSYGPSGYIKYKGDRFELKGWGGYDFGGKSAIFGATASIDIFAF